MDLNNFNKEEISNIFVIIKDRFSKECGKNRKLSGQENNLGKRINAFLKREKAIWEELGYRELFAGGIDAWDRMNTRRIFAAGGAVLAVGMVAFTVHVATQPNAYSFEINGTQIGYVESPEIVDQAVASLEKEIMDELGVESVTIEEGVIACTATRVKKLNLLEEEEIEDEILGADVCSLEAWTIEVDGRTIVTAATQELANQILDNVKENYRTEGTELVSASYKEAVAVKPCSAGVDDIMEADKAISYILTGQEEPQTYTVKEGDTLWDIAYANGMKPAELVAANPDFVPERMQIGQVLNLIAIKPYLTVTTTEKLVATEAIPFETVYKDDSSIARGKTKVVTAGVNGQKQVVSEVTKENGKLVSTNVLSETTLSDPVTQVASRGTRSSGAVYTARAGSTKGTGRLGNPLSSIVPSANGGMYGASRGGRRHLGVDLRSSKGAPIYAADSGTIIRVSSTGSYGKLIVVDHGNGIVTKYAHCNSIGVSAGQAVRKGEQIGTVGNTGNATGYILHFEVLVNGSNVNPLNYL